MPELAPVISHTFLFSVGSDIDQDCTVMRWGFHAYGEPDLYTVNGAGGHRATAPSVVQPTRTSESKIRNHGGQ